MRNVLLLAAIVAAAFAIYTSNGDELASYDSAPNSLLGFTVLQQHRLDFDRFRGSYFPALGGQGVFVEAPNGHLSSLFPVGAGIVAFPLAAAFYVARGGEPGVGTITAPAFEPLRRQFEKTAAALLAAVSVALFLLCAREIANPVQAAIATIVYALATSIWSIGSQALWQHGPVNLFVLAMVYALLRASSARDSAHVTAWLVAAGVCAGFLPVIRPTAALFSAAGGVFAWWTFRARSLPFALALVAGVAPGVAWNAYFFHSLVGGYAGDARLYAWSPQALTSFAALLVSPSKGLFAYSPVLAFSFAGVVRARSGGDPRGRLVVLLALACAVLAVQYAFYRSWWGGFAYGPRFLSDVDAVAALALAYALPQDPLAYVRRGGVAAVAALTFTLTLLFSVLVQFAGVNSGAAGSEWNAVPISIDRDPDRVWPVHDNQIERNMRAAYVRFFAWDVARSSDYASGVAVRVTGVAPSLLQAASGSAIAVTAGLSNAGRSRIYGYASGVYVGQLRLRVRILDARNPSPADQFLYVATSPRPGEGASATGTIELPAHAGRYRIAYTPVLVGGTSLAPASNRSYVTNVPLITLR